MKNFTILFIGLFVLTSAVFGQIFMDGKETDWENEPVLISAPDNTPGGFPEDVKAAVTDVVDVKEVKAKIMDDVFYTQIKFWGGPAWPNNAYIEDRDGVMSVRHRGYYHMGIDLDNDPTTGAENYYYEAHYTPVGYLSSLGQDVEPIGSEAAVYWGCDYEWAPEGTDPNEMTVKYIAYEYSDWSSTQWINDDDQSKGILAMGPANPDHAKAMSWSGAFPVAGSEVELFKDDSTSMFFAGHGWGYDFLEMAFDLRPLKQYFGAAHFAPGNVFGIAPMIETPIDDWAVDQTTRGEVYYPGTGTPEMPFAMDGQEDDWSSEPVLINAPDNTPGGFPEDVKAAVNDVVDVKEVKARIVDDVFFTQIKFWGGPAWPNNAYVEDRDGVMSVRHRGYYHMGIDLDNDPTTGAENYYYEAHYTPVGYLSSLGQDVEPIGSEAAVYWGCDYEWAPEGTDPDDMNVKYIAYEYSDWSSTQWINDDDQSKGILALEAMHPDNMKAMAWSGLAPVAGSEVELFKDDSTSLFYAGHGWGYDFLEMAFDLEPLKQYFGSDLFTAGNVFGIAPMIETPIDDWAVDQTTRGEVAYPGPAIARPFTMDGIETDWADEPVLINAPDNTPGGFPEDVKAAVNDVVDVKEVKARIVDDVFFTQIKFWGGPAWPNNAYVEDRDGVMSVRHRGYYHMGIDLDNDPTTGAENYYYEAHYTPVGYLSSLGQDVEPIGSEAAVYWGCDYEWAPVDTDPNDMTVKYVAYEYSDWSSTQWINDDDQSKGILAMGPANPSNTKAMAWSGMLHPDGSEVELFKDDSTSLFYAGHGWGYDFLEMAFDLKPLKMYFGEENFQEGNVFGIAPMIETPIDDWAVDQTTRGEVPYVAPATSVRKLDALADEFRLDNNYPNPFNPTTTIQFALPANSTVKLAIYNMLGQRVRTLIDKQLSAGSHAANWDGRNDFGQKVSSGIYLYRIESGFGVQTKKMTLMK